jgi:hypothetical protein
MKVDMFGSQKMSKTKSKDLFVKSFSLEYVEILTDMSTRQIVEGNEGPEEIHLPMVVYGFVMDADDTFVYLSFDGENVNQALPMSIIKHIQIISEEDQLDEMLDQIGAPEGEQGYN